MPSISTFKEGDPVPTEFFSVCDYGTVTFGCDVEIVETKRLRIIRPFQKSGKHLMRFDGPLKESPVVNFAPHTEFRTDTVAVKP